MGTYSFGKKGENFAFKMLFIKKSCHKVVKNHQSFEITKLPPKKKDKKEKRKTVVIVGPQNFVDCHISIPN
jgi:hypothetical protein